MEQYKANSLALIGAVGMGAGVMIGAGIFALTGQVAELAGNLFPVAFPSGGGDNCRFQHLLVGPENRSLLILLHISG